MFTISIFGQQLVRPEVKRVVIDAGHGGKDPGAIGTFSKEKDIVLSIALKLGEAIKKNNPDVKVIYTREKDEFLELFQRANIANKAKADLFISIHANSVKANKDANGLEFFVLGPHKNDANLEVAKRENAVVNLENNIAENYGFDPNSPDGHIIMTMKQSLYMDNSIQLAKKMESSFENDENQSIRGVKQAGFVVLYQTAMPSCLVEVGFISNQKEEEYINSEEGQNSIATKLESAFTQYKQKVERKSENSNSPKIETPEIKKSNTPETHLPKTVNNSSEAAKLSSSEITPRIETKKVISLMENEEESIAFKNNKKKVELVSKKIEEDRKKENLPVLEIKEKTEAKIDTTYLSKKIENLPIQTIEKKTNADFMEIASNMQNNSDIDIEIKKAPIKLERKNESIDSVRDDIIIAHRKPRIVLDDATKNEIKQEVKSHFNIGSELLDSEIKQSNKIAPKPIVSPKEAKPNSPNQNTATPKKPNALVQKNDISKSNNNEKPKDLIFYVQVLAAPSNINKTNKIYKDFGTVKESYEGGMYKYLVGQSSEIEEAKKTKLKALEKGYKDAFVVIYHNGIRLK